MGLVFLLGFASAYQVNINAPVSLSIGKPLIVTGITTLPPGMYIDVVLYYQVTTSTEVEIAATRLCPCPQFGAAIPHRLHCPANRPDNRR